MDTSLRYGGDSSALRFTTNDNNNPPAVKYAGDVTALKIHVKQKLRIHSNTQLQLNGELDTGKGAPTFVCALVRHFYPDLSASLGAGLQYDRNDKLFCTVRGKKAYPVASSRFVNFVLKGRCDIDRELEPTPNGALELVWNVLDFQKDQDVRLKLGYEIVDKIPYVQIRENNWTFNADINGRWNHVPILTDDAADVVRWKDVHGNAIDFSIREASRSIIGIDPLVPWTKFVWFKGHVPKFSFCMWTACCWRLPTQDRIGTWFSGSTSLSCALCDECIDSHDHLFFGCTYSREVWRRIKVEFGLFGFPEIWTDIMEVLCDNRGPSKMVHRLALSGTVYHIWRERNRRLFRDVKQLPIVTYRQVRDQIRLYTASWRIGKKT
ncbi:hypothetical protein OSB04_028458 [Centaurea solstitialis]|uniref:Reverse transcriptase zinc-binding domain-containing protein n=1 Tax=Centaurea solstitialis TaxID=347529 RepID=A0AA38W0M9_9ASTR|nr:hypothetical protein OSB04_028458 [Centaurea solstitialis]